MQTAQNDGQAARGVRHAVLHSRHVRRFEHPAMNDQNVVTGGGQLLDDRATDEPSPAQDDDPHGSYLLRVVLKAGFIPAVTYASSRLTCTCASPFKIIPSTYRNGCSRARSARR